MLITWLFHSYIIGVLKTLQYKASDVYFLEKPAWILSWSFDVVGLKHPITCGYTESSAVPSTSFFKPSLTESLNCLLLNLYLIVHFLHIISFVAYLGAWDECVSLDAHIVIHTNNAPLRSCSKHHWQSLIMNIYVLFILRLLFHWNEVSATNVCQSSVNLLSLDEAMTQTSVDNVILRIKLCGDAYWGFTVIRGQNNRTENNLFSEMNLVITLYRTMCYGTCSKLDR